MWWLTAVKWSLRNWKLIVAALAIALICAVVGYAYVTTVRLEKAQKDLASTEAKLQAEKLAHEAATKVNANYVLQKEKDDAKISQLQRKLAGAYASDIHAAKWGAEPIPDAILCARWGLHCPERVLPVVRD